MAEPTKEETLATYHRIDKGVNTFTLGLNAVAGAIGGAYAFVTGYLIKNGHKVGAARAVHSSLSTSIPVEKSAEELGHTSSLAHEVGVAEVQEMTREAAEHFTADLAASVPGNHVFADRTLTGLPPFSQPEAREAFLKAERARVAQEVKTAAKAGEQSVFFQKLEEGGIKNFLKSPITLFKEMPLRGKALMGAVMGGFAAAAYLLQRRRIRKIDAEYAPQIEQALKEDFPDAPNASQPAFAEKVLAERQAQAPAEGIAR